MGILGNKLVEELRKHLGLELDDEDELSTEDALLLLNRSFWEMLNKIEFKEKERTVPFTLVTGKRKYKLPVLVASIEGITVIDPETLARDRLEKIDNYVYDHNYVGTEDSWAIPTQYYREGDYVIFLATPDQDYDIELRCLITIDDISDTSVFPKAPKEWHEVILFGAITRGFLGLGDYNKAGAARAFQASLWDTLEPVKAKETVDMHEAHFEVKGYTDYV